MPELEKALQVLGFSRDELKGQTAVITGAGRGIGLTTAQAFAWLGANVVIAEKSAPGEAVDTLIKHHPAQVLFVNTDVSNEDSVARLYSETRRAFGSTDFLFNNAIYCPVASVLETEPAVWDRVIAVNLRGGFLTCRAFLPDMIARGKGVIINMISTDAMPHLSAYIASKQGLAAFSQSLAGEVGDNGVHVIAFAPGFVRTPGLSAVGEALAHRLGLTEEAFLNMSLHPAYEGAMPVSDAAAAAAYLAVRCSAKHHGEQISGYEVLEQAGYLHTGGKPALFSMEQSFSGSSGENLQQLAARLQAVINETEAEFDRLPVFVRPMARRGFKGKSGLSTGEWSRLVNSLGREAAANQKICQHIQGLLTYYKEVPAETRRFVRDPAVLQEVEQISNERVSLIEELARRL